MSKIIQKILRIFIIFVILGTNISHSIAAIPSEYMANPKIRDPRNEIVEILVRIEAYRKTGTSIPTEVFSRLNSNFNIVFPNLPQNPSYKIVYEQCKITSNNLVGGYSFDKFTSFNTQCHQPLNSIIKEVNSDNTVSVNIKTNPSSGPAPLNVTLDARGSIDPSNDTIPDANFYWYYKDTAGNNIIIGQGPVVNHTFAQAGNYIIHSTVRSSNWSKGILDGEASIAVDVLPQAANIVVFAGGKKMLEDQYTKIGSSEAKSISIDGSATTPNGGRKILNHKREVKGANSNNNYNWSQIGQGNPGAIRISLPNNGSYIVTLSVSDNQNNNISKNYNIVVSDPVAVIKTTPEAGDTSTRFAIDSAGSYSVTSKIKIYKREIYDPQGSLLDSFQAKDFNRQFNKPGTYTFKLSITDELGNTNIEQHKLYISSTSPTPQFTITPAQKRKNPSQFILDAGASSDIDVNNGLDTLYYEWKFSDPNNVSIDKTLDGGKKIMISMKEQGNYKATLVVKDKYTKYSEITKDISVESTVRPMIIVEKNSSVRGKDINFQVKSNKDIVSYRRDFGDGINKSIQTANISHKFDRVGIYNVTLKVNTANLEENEITIPIFIGEADKPIAVYDVINEYQEYMLPNDICNIDGKDMPAYSVDRYQPIEINSSNSLDTKGNKNNLKAYFKPQNDDIFKGYTLRYKFAELGCHSVDISVEDINENAIDNKTIYFKVKNSLPKINNVVVTFPQYGNEMGVGFMQTRLKDPSFEQFDPLVVRVVADSPVDYDGQISYFTRYYYKSDDPDRLLDIKVTPGNINGINFVLSREAGEYTFGVKMTDNDGGEHTSEEIIGRGPVVFVKPKGNESQDIPIVTLKSDTTNIKVGDEVTLYAQAKILSNRADFVGSRIFKFDVDGNGIDDITTKNDTIKYIYDKASPENKPFKPKVKVIYRDKVGVGFGDSISVKKGIKPKFILQKYDKTVIIVDTTLGLPADGHIYYCMDLKNCKNPGYTKIDEKSFMFTYPDYGKYMIKLVAKDNFGNLETYKERVTLEEVTEKKFVELVTIPSYRGGEDGLYIDLGKGLSNTMSIYSINNTSGDCKITISDPNQTIKCGELTQINFGDDISESQIKLSYNTDKGPTTKVIKVNLIDNKIIIPEKYQKIATQIDQLQKNIVNKSEYKDLSESLKTLRKSLGDSEQRTSELINISNNLSGYSKDPSVGSGLQAIISSIADQSSTAIGSSNPYDLAKSEIIAVVSPNIQDQIKTAFANIDATDDKVEIQSQLTGILAIVKSDIEKGNMDGGDFDTIKSYICDIAKYKEIATTSCNNTEATNTSGVVVASPVITDNSSTNTSTSSGLSTTLNIILWILGILVFGFVGLVIFYAIKARSKKSTTTSTPPATV